MRVGLAQLNATVGDFSGNCAKIKKFYQHAIEMRAGLVLTPELAITGYPPRDLLAKRRFVHDNILALEELTKHIGPTALAVGYVDINQTSNGRQYYNAVALIRNGEIIARRYKTLLPTYDVFDEDRYFQSGETNRPVFFENQKIGLTICEDIWTLAEENLDCVYQRDPIAELNKVSGGIDLLCNISASPFHVGKEATRYNLLRETAVRYKVPLVYCNLVGGNDELIFDGNSMAFDEDGVLIGQAKAFQEDLLMVDLHQKESVTFSTPKQIETVHNALVLGLRDYASKCGFQSAVLGLSGGVDSAVTACIAVEALGAANVKGVSLPSQFSSQGSLEDAKALAKKLGIQQETIPIQPVYEAIKTTLFEQFVGLSEDATEENIQARIRGIILMAISNKFGHLLLTTGNKSELAVGYCTLYGDMAGGLAVIADVPKTTVYELARFINRHHEIIPVSSITKPPSAELRPNQTDQDTLPSYEVLDQVLKKYVEEFKSAQEIISELGIDEQIVREIVRKIDLNEYKRKQAPPCLRVTTKAFGIGRRMPIAQRYVGR